MMVSAGWLKSISGRSLQTSTTRNEEEVWLHRDLKQRSVRRHTLFQSRETAGLFRGTMKINIWGYLEYLLCEQPSLFLESELYANAARVNAPNADGEPFGPLGLSNPQPAGYGTLPFFWDGMRLDNLAFPYPHRLLNCVLPGLQPVVHLPGQLRSTEIQGGLAESNPATD